MAFLRWRPRVRVDANARWDVDEGVVAIRALDRAAGGLEYVEQPCVSVDELAAVRRRVEVRIAADESIRRAEDPLRVALAEAADVAVLTCAPLGGVRRALAVAQACGLSCVVSSALETSVGLAAEVALAAALPRLGFACGLGTGVLLDGDVVAGGAGLVPVDGWLPVPRQSPEPVRRGAVSADPSGRHGGRRGWPGCRCCSRTLVERPLSMSVVVVGAGLAGVACAVELTAAGVPVRVLERSAAVGGRMASTLVARTPRARPPTGTTRTPTAWYPRSSRPCVSCSACRTTRCGPASTGGGQRAHRDGLAVRDAARPGGGPTVARPDR